MAKGQSKFKLTEREVILAVTFAVIGFFTSIRPWILFLNSLNPIEGLVVYYIILYSSLYVLSRLGLTVFGLKIDKPLQILGLAVITFAFFILVDWTSAYVQITVTGSVGNISNVYLSSEDGATFYLWYDVLGIKTLEIARLLTYVLTPGLLALLGGFLLEDQAVLSHSIDWAFWRKKK
jgi:hypothetical protein